MTNRRLRSHKPLLFASTGAAAGLLAALLNAAFYRCASPYFFVKDMRAPTGTERMLASYLGDVLIFGLFGAVCTVALIWANGFHQRTARPKIKRLASALAIGALGALGSTLLAKKIFVVALHALPRGPLTQYLLRSLCWAAIGAVVGLALSRTIPNLRWSRGLLGGASGGFLGGALTTFLLFGGNSFLAGALSFALTGAILGASIAAVEKLFREASAEVVWAPNDRAVFDLGPQPLTIGGENDDILIAGLPRHFASLRFADGRIEHIETRTNTRTPLRHGSRLKFGEVEVVIHAERGSRVNSKK
jgi:hypothetical protein